MDFYLQMYPDDPVIIEASVNLVVAMFKAIENSVAFYTGHKVARGLKALVSGDDYGKKILQSLENVKLCCSALESEANRSFQQRTYSDSQDLKRSNAAIMEGTMACSQQVTVLQGTFNALLAVLSDKDRNWAPILLSPLPSRPNSPQPVYLTPKDLWHMLGGTQTDFDNIDMNYVRETEGEIVPEERATAEQVITTRHFRRWINRAGNAKLLVHGDFDSEEDTSPLSIVCFTITFLFRQWTSRGIISLVFFCGRHMEWYKGGKGMIISFLSQLMRQFPFPTIQPGFEVSGEILKGCSVEDLCQLFESLVRQLPQSTTIFCLLDGIDRYERKGYMKGMESVVWCLLKLVERPPGDMGARVKLLLTSPQPTSGVRLAFEDDPDTLLHAADLPVELDPMGMAGFQQELGGGGWD